MSFVLFDVNVVAPEVIPVLRAGRARNLQRCHGSKCRTLNGFD